MKKHELQLAILAVSLAAAMSANASLSLVVNGDFESGNTGFSSDYAYSPPAFISDPGTYTLGLNPAAVYSAWAYGPAGDHTGGGLMMIVNGTETPNLNVWAGTLSSALVVGQWYEFSAWVANIYTESPPTLDFTIGGVSIGTFTPSGTGTWQQFKGYFQATANQATAAIDQNLAFMGNDFALDDISIVTSAVPEPTTMIAGAGVLGLALLGIGRARSSRVVRIGK
jgi:hypothetical protein